MKYDYSKLRGKIKEVCETQNKFAEKLNIGRVSLSQRLTGKLEFSQDEILKSVSILDLNREDIPEYFFSTKVSDSKPKQIA